jgi:hypothetical protein
LFQVVERLNFHWLGHFGNRHDKDFALVSLHCRVHVREMVELVFRDDRTLALIVVVNGQRPLGTHYKFPLVASQDSSFFVRNYGFSLPDILNFGGGGYYMEDSHFGSPWRVSIVSHPLFIRPIRNLIRLGPQIHSVFVSAVSTGHEGPVPPLGAQKDGSWRGLAAFDTPFHSRTPWPKSSRDFFSGSWCT